jgi:hypothetical protein
MFSCLDNYFTAREKSLRNQIFGNHGCRDYGFSSGPDAKLKKNLHRPNFSSAG